MLPFRIQWREVVSYGLVLSIVFGAAVLFSWWIEPRAWSSDFPIEVQERLGPMPARAMYVSLSFRSST
ncbi:MAG: hypothetical protein AAGA54_36345, partial [Myxococcota bacterium]